MIDFEQIYADHFADVYQVCFKMLKHREDAEDVTQETFLYFFSNMHRFHDTNLKALLKKTATFFVRKFWFYKKWKNKSRRIWRDGEYRGVRQPFEPDLPIDDIENLRAAVYPIDEKIAIGEALRTLERRTRKAFVLHDVCELELGEIGNRVGMSKSWVWLRVSAARKHLRENQQAYV